MSFCNIRRRSRSTERFDEFFINGLRKGKIYRLGAGYLFCEINGEEGLYVEYYVKPTYCKVSCFKDGIKFLEFDKIFNRQDLNTYSEYHHHKPMLSSPHQKVENSDIDVATMMLLQEGRPKETSERRVISEKRKSIFDDLYVSLEGTSLYESRLLQQMHEQAMLDARNRLMEMRGDWLGGRQETLDDFVNHRAHATESIAIPIRAHEQDNVIVETGWLRRLIDS